MEGQAGLEQVTGHRHVHASIHRPMCLQLSVDMGLHKQPCPHTGTHTHPHVHTFTHVLLSCLCICLPACAHTRVHAFTTAHHTYVDMFTHKCSRSPLALVLPGMGLCSSLSMCVSTHGMYSSVCACVLTCMCMHSTCVCMCSAVCTDIHVPVCPHAATCSHSACFQPFIYMRPGACMHLTCCVLSCIHRCLYTCHLHMHGHTSTLLCFCANVHVHML